MASKAPIKVRIKEFRGSTRDLTIQLDHKKTLSLIYGENASGKTTICDAFDFIGNGKVGSLENRGLGQLHPYWPTLGKTSANILVELTADGTTWKAQANARNVGLSPTAPPVPKIELLRRSSILRLVQDAPKERYDALRPFIDISLAEQAESTLRSQIKEGRTTQNEATIRIEESRESLEGLWKESGSAYKDALSWANSIVTIPPADQTSAIKALRNTIKSLETLVHSKEMVAKAQDEVAAAAIASTSANAERLQAEAGSASEDTLLIEILEAAHTHFSNHKVGTVCPLCESSDKISKLDERVRDRLSHLTALTDKRRAGDLAEKQLAAKQATRNSLQERAKELAVAAFESIEKTPSEWALKTSQDWDSINQIGTSGDLSKLDAAFVQTACNSASQLASQLENKSTWFKSVKTLLEQYQNNVARQARLSQILPKLELALEICEAQRKTFLDGLLSSIALEVGRIYELIHPGEGLNKIAIKLDPKKTGSLDLTAEFLKKTNQPPHAYFSESHLDSLGLCIFLALAGQNKTAETVVVMDDVLGSIDEPHVDRLVQMLYAESTKFKHTIITTHYRPWREKFRWGWLKNGQCELIELADWNNTQGIRTTDVTTGPLIELRQHLVQTPPSLQASCASAGVLLEAICDYLTGLYECDVPRRKGKLTLGDLLPRIGVKLKTALRIEIKQADGTYSSKSLTDIIDQLQQMAQLRNIFGCHYNDLSMHLPDGDALKFATLVEELGSALICDDEGWPGSDKSGSYWATRDETRRLHPLKKPK